MAAARANWKGSIKFGEVAVAVPLYTAASSSELIAFNTVNRDRKRARREFVDSETGELVERDEQVKGYEVENGDYVVLEPEGVASAVPEWDERFAARDYRAQAR
jgi:DNA end-binding protein Ku